MTKKRKNPRNAPIDRFIWKAGDLKTVYDPYAEERKKRSEEEARKKRSNDDPC